jgi:hypothetical protein
MLRSNALRLTIQSATAAVGRRAERARVRHRQVRSGRAADPLLEPAFEARGHTAARAVAHGGQETIVDLGEQRCRQAELVSRLERVQRIEQRRTGARRRCARDCVASHFRPFEWQLLLVEGTRTKFDALASAEHEDRRTERAVQVA